MNRHTTDPQDRENQKVALMAELGFHTRAIADATGLSESQVNSRTSLYGIRRRDYRDGRNEASSRVLVLAIGSVSKPQRRIFQQAEMTTMAESYAEVRERVRKRIAAQAKEAREKKKRADATKAKRTR